MRTLTSMAALAAALVFAGSASAATLYSNNFDTENGGAGATQLNYTGFNGLTVTGGSVDLVRTPDAGVTCAGGSGSCVDLDGSTNQDGTVFTGFYAFNAGDTITFSFDLSGNQRDGNTDIFGAALIFGSATTGTGFFTGAFDPGTLSTTTAHVAAGGFFAGNNPFQTFVIGFVATQAGTVKAGIAADRSNDNVGPLLDNFRLELTSPGNGVPEPATWAMMVMGFGAAGAMVRRRRTALTA